MYRDTLKFLIDQSPDGTLDPDYTTFVTNLPGQIKPKGGNEIYRGQQLQAETTNVIELRYYPGLQPNMIVENVSTGQRYLIRRIINDNNRSRELMIEATEVVI